MRKLITPVVAASVLSGGLFFNPATINAIEPVQQAAPVEQTEEEVEIITVIEDPSVMNTHTYPSDTILYTHNDNNEFIHESPFIVNPDVIVSDGGTFTWDYVNTMYGNNVAYNNITYYSGKAVAGGLSAWFVSKLPTYFLKGAAGSVAATATLNIKASQNTWWTVRKWTDYDAYNEWVKYEVKLYSNSGRTNLIKSYVQVHKS
jgi:hypothetical protein